MNTRSQIALVFGLLAQSSVLLAAPLADEPAAGEKPFPETRDAAAELPLAQEQVLKKYQRFEEVLLRMSELTSASDPKRAALLRKAVGQSKDRLIGVQFDRLVNLLKRDQLATAVTNQKEVEKDLRQLLDLLLSEQRADRLKSERERIKEQIRRINELINKQQQLEGQTQGTADPKKLTESQGKLAEQTGKLAEEMKDATEEPKKQDEEGDDEEETGDRRSDPKEGDRKEGDAGKGGSKKAEPQEGQSGPSQDDERKTPEEGDSEEKGKPSPKESQPNESQPNDGQPQGKPQEGQPQEGQPAQPQQEGEQNDSSDQPPPSDSEAARQRVREAQKAMEQARQKLEQAKREGAAEDQEEARRKLEQAKARLEEVLRQLREEEVERSLALLEARFRKMLQTQTEVYEGTVRVDRVKPEDRTHNEEIEAGRLSRQERAILDELTGAETLLREDGTSVAFPEAVQELREDMEQVAARLAEAKVDQVTQLTEQDILAALEEMIAAFQKARKENEEKQQRQQPQQSGEQQDPPLVDAIAELKMIRALQMRVNKRTTNYSKLVDGEEGQAEKAELIEALEKLSQREERIYRTTRDIVLGKNQ
ncbi:MAG TPA: hypothetical protein VG826_25405 [Pirellulales bacterium]|nr:hypothetical protein [Pirellulales bacterium]